MASAATEGKKKRKQPRHQQSAPSKETGDDVLAAVQLIDSEAVEILSTSLNVALYEFRDASWVKLDIQGKFIVYRRRALPQYTMLLLNCLGSGHFIEPIVPNLDLQFSNNFLLFSSCRNGFSWPVYEELRVEKILLCKRILVAADGSNSSSLSRPSTISSIILCSYLGNVYGLWLCEITKLLEVGNLLRRLVDEATLSNSTAPPQLATAPLTPTTTTDGHDIIQMLHEAHQRAWQSPSVAGTASSVTPTKPACTTARNSTVTQSAPQVGKHSAKANRQDMKRDAVTKSVQPVDAALSNQAGAPRVGMFASPDPTVLPPPASVGSLSSTAPSEKSIVRTMQASFNNDMYRGHGTLDTATAGQATSALPTSDHALYGPAGSAFAIPAGLGVGTSAVQYPSSTASLPMAAMANLSLVSSLGSTASLPTAAMANLSLVSSLGSTAGVTALRSAPATAHTASVAPVLSLAASTELMRPDDFQALPAPVQLDGSPPLAVPSVINPDIRRTSAPSVVSVGSATGHLAPGGVPGLTVDQMQQSLIYMIKHNPQFMQTLHEAYVSSLNSHSSS